LYERENNEGPDMTVFRLFSSLILILGMLEMTAAQQKKPRATKSTNTGVEAYRVCHEFQKVLADKIDFNAAFDATFTPNVQRQRAIAIKDGEFGDIDLSKVEDSTLINAYKSRMQIVYLMLPLLSPANDEEEALFFPPEIKQVFDRKPPSDPAEFATYSAQLESDARSFRAHLDSLVEREPSVAERVRNFKKDLVSEGISPNAQLNLKPIRYSGGGDVLHNGESYYQIEGYTVVREGTRMRIVGIRFFTRLF
jgi:hypothetical protein